MSSAQPPAPVFVVPAIGADAGPLVASLSRSGATGIGALPADGGDQSVSRLAESVPGARFVFLAGAADHPPPPALERLAPGRWCRVAYARLLDEPRRELARVCVFAGIAYDQALLGPLEEASRGAQTGDRGAARSPFASVSTPGFGQTLEHMSISLLTSTYQTGRLICARAAEGSLNTHFREFDKPMGIGVAPGRIALGTRTEVWDLRDMPEAAAALAPPGRHDACYLPRNRHVTGDIAVHDLAFAGGELWLVATAFSCLATLDAGHSFVPRWTPPFITRLAPEDRCHLNGLAVVGDRVAYVTALGAGDEPGSWRAGKARGGVLIDVASGEVAIGGLSMPHSPRWHRGRLWLLESGTGSLCLADPQQGSVQVVTDLPGFTRGLAVLDDVAFVGLSQVRESSTFGDLPVTRRLTEPTVRRVDGRPGVRLGGRLLALRRPRAGDLRRRGACEDTLAGNCRGGRHDHSELVRAALSRRGGGTTTTSSYVLPWS